MRPDDPSPDGERLAPGVRVPHDKLKFSATASSGPGGQHANRRSTRAVLRVAVADLPITPGAKARVRQNAGALRVGDPPDDELVIANEDTRSLARNKAACLDRLRTLIAESLRPPTPRRPTRPTRASQRRRVDDKRARGETKQRRRPPRHDD